MKEEGRGGEVRCLKEWEIEEEEEKQSSKKAKIKCFFEQPMKSRRVEW